MRRRRDVPFSGLFWLFGAFILGCGTTHLMEVIVTYWPAYRLAGLIKVGTAAVSLATVAALVPIIPRALRMRSPEELERLVRERTEELARANAALWSEREWFRTTLASIGDAVITTDPSGRVTFLNPVAEALTGWPLEEAAGRPFDEVFRLVDARDGGAMPGPVERVLRTGQPVGVENHAELIARDGTGRPIDDSAAPIRDGRGALGGVVLVFRDISGRRRAERERAETLALLDTVIQNAPIGIALYDPDLRYTRVNGVAARDHGLAAEAHVGRTPTELLGATGRGIEGNLRRVVSTGGAAVGLEVSGETPAEPGATRHWLASYFPIGGGDGARPGACAMFLDITDRKLAEVALRESDRRKEEFLATLAHELRNPLAPVGNGLAMLRSGGAGPDDQAAVLDMMDRQHRQLVRLVDDLLDIGRISRGKLALRRQPMDLAEAVASALEASRPLIDAAGLALEVRLPDRPLALSGDLTRLAQVTSNLLNNAAKYTPRGGRVAVELRRDGEAAVLTVEDTGIGMPAELIPRIFDMFAQGERGIERSRGGLGIGLTLVRRLVELHGGSVEARSAGPGEGSRFVVRLPLTAVASEGPSGAPGGPLARSDGAPRRVLVVDDSRDSADSLALLLRRKGHEVRVAYGGPEALEAVGAFRPEVVLLDIGMPGLSGYDVARALRALPETREALLIAQTGWGQESDRRRSADSGIDAHLVKPVNPQELLRLLAASR